MKLIRLYSQNPKGIFDNEFNEDIIIEPNSKIALQSFSAQIDTEEMTIDSQNDYMQFKIVDTSPDFKGFHISHGIFNSSNYGSLFSDISLKMNKLMDNVTNELGRQWEIGDNVSNKHVNFSLKLGTYVAPESTDPKVVPLVGKVNCVGTTAGLFNRSNTVDPTKNNAFLYVRSPNCKGASSFRARLYSNPASGVAQGCILAYLASPPDRNQTVIDQADILYGIRMVGIGERYKYIVNGVEVAHSTLNAQVAGTNNKDNDYLSIDTSRGAIQLNVYRGNTKHDLFTGIYDHIKDLFPVLIFVGDSNFRINAIKFTSDPFYNVVNVPVNETELGTIIPAGGAQTSIKTLQFADTDLAKFFGFKRTEYKSPDVYEWDFNAENSFQPSDFSDSYIIEMLNLNIDAYDGWNKQHKNILSTITQADVIRERLTYSANFPIFLNLLNPTRLLLRRISARLLREDFSAVNLTGFSQITIIISQ